MFFWYDPTYLLLIPALIFALYAQSKVSSTFQRYLRVASSSGLTGAQVARRILDSNGLYDVAVEQVGGHLTDHYDPAAKYCAFLPVYGSTSVAALGVAAHETGHAIQHAQLRALGYQEQLVPHRNIGSQMAFPLFIMGFVFQWDVLMLVGIWFFIAALAFQVVTLPVEFDASRRAIALLTNGGYIAPMKRLTPRQC